MSSSRPQGKVRVPAGGLIGRAAQASLRIDRVGVSEAHALVTLRGRQLRLLALRGELKVLGQSTLDCLLTEGVEVELADDVILRVEQISIPGMSLKLIIEDTPFIIARLPCTIIAAAHIPANAVVHHTWSSLALIDGLALDGAIWLSDDDQGLLAGPARDIPKSIRLPAEWVIDHQKVHLGTVPHSGTHATMGSARRNTRQPLRISARYHSVHIWTSAARPITITGICARILSELVLLNMGPVGWEVVASEVWAAQREARQTLRDNWDKALQRLRKLLRVHGIREDLVQTDRHGNIELLLYEGDSVTDDTGESP